MNPEVASVIHNGKVIDYLVVRSARRTRTVAVTVRRGEGVRVLAPIGTRRDEINSLVLRQADWILERIVINASTVPDPGLVEGTVLPFAGREITLTIAKRIGGRSVAKFEAGTLRVTSNILMDDDDQADSVRRTVVNWYSRQALAFVTDAVTRWSAVVGRTPTQVVVRDQKRVWGTCSQDGILRLNWRLAMVEPSLVDYVVVHELCHMIEHNHSKAFWAEVERVLPDMSERKTRLRPIAKALPL